MNFQKITMLFMLVSLTQLAHTQEQPALYPLDNQQSMVMEKTPERYSLDDFDLDVKTTEIDLLPGQPQPADTQQPILLESQIVNDYFTTRQVITEIWQETIDGKTYRTTKTWTTKNPSYFTWTNAAAAAGAVGATGLGIAAYTGNLNLPEITNVFSSSTDATISANTLLAEKDQTANSKTTAPADQSSSGYLASLGTAGAAAALTGAFIGSKIGTVYGAHVAGKMYNPQMHKEVIAEVVKSAPSRFPRSTQEAKEGWQKISMLKNNPEVMEMAPVYGTSGFAGSMVGKVAGGYAGYKLVGNQTASTNDNQNQTPAAA